MIDPQASIIAFLRDAAVLDGVLDTFTLPGLSGRAVFRTEAPEAYRPRAAPFIIVDPFQEGPRSLGSFSSRTPMFDVPVRIFALIRDEGDEVLAQAAWRVHQALLDAALTFDGGVLNDIDCRLPEETPTSGPSIGGRRLNVRMLITLD
ncbi:MAG: hypothetical protein IPK75_12790 [Acidobacteria bacterium]|nr:hypothetical protein [Acidobacteriota bacterium]